MNSPTQMNYYNPSIRPIPYPYPRPEWHRPYSIYANQPMPGWTTYPESPLIAIAYIKGGPLAPDLKGTVVFKDVPGGTMVYVSVVGLPPYTPAQKDNAPIGPHGLHIHENGNCEVGESTDPFQAAGGHWNPDGQPHGNHASDFPVLFSNHGQAYMCFFTDRFHVQDVVGKSVIIHQNPDDYRSQPAGNAGKRLACGIIQYSYNPIYPFQPVQ